MQVIWTPEAVTTFNQNIAYLQQEWNDKVIERFIDKTDKLITLISEQPLLFPSAHKKKSIRKCLVVKQVSLYYRVQKDTIYLITFWNNYQHPRKLKL